VPIERVGLYVPGGATPLFSTALMLGVPADIAGCPDIFVCTPPREDGTVDTTILYAAHVAGVRRVFRVGGAQAVAAMATGTETIPRVDKIFGPGNQYVTAAKQLAAVDGVAIDLPAGPSEVLVVADSSADPDFVAADLLAQAEHGSDSQVVLVTDDESLADAVPNRIEAQLARLPRRDIARAALGNARCIVVHDLRDAVEFANAYAPEHLILMVAQADELAARVRAAGSVFLGSWAPEAAGDYASGTNHTLPTNGYAAAWSGVSVESFMKTITFQRISEDGLRALASTVERMALGEGLDAHARAVRVRLDRAGVGAS
jgi:histidinol dehydrogenase